MHILFFVDGLDDTEIVTGAYDYAVYADAYLGHTIRIACSSSTGRDQAAIQAFELRFGPVIHAQFVYELVTAASTISADHIHIFNAGYFNADTLATLHACDAITWSVHNARYWVASAQAVVGNLVIDAPHNTPIVPLPIHPVVDSERCGNLRDSLGISTTAIVIGIRGEVDGEAVSLIATAAESMAVNLRFLVSAEASRVIPALTCVRRTDPVVTLEDRVRFINTCDAVLDGPATRPVIGNHLAEFVVCGRPVISERVGLDLLGYNLFCARVLSRTNLPELFETIAVRPAQAKIAPVELFSGYAPQAIMCQFASVFLGQTPPTSLYGIPTQLSIPDSNVRELTPAVRDWSSVIPGRKYEYAEESVFMQQYAESRFAVTGKKAGWDCMRHLEIMATGCVPYFRQLELCPPQTLNRLPKKLLLKAKALPGMPPSGRVDAVWDGADLNLLALDKTQFNVDAYETLRAQIHQHTNQHLTCSKMAQRLLDACRMLGPIQTICILSEPHYIAKLDYMRDSVFIGMSALPSVRCVHAFPELTWVFKSDEPRKWMYGRGFNVCNTVDRGTRTVFEHPSNAAAMRQAIAKGEYDLVLLCTSSNCLPPDWASDWAAAAPRGTVVAFVDGNDLEVAPSTVRYNSLKLTPSRGAPTQAVLFLGVDVGCRMRHMFLNMCYQRIIPTVHICPDAPHYFTNGYTGWQPDGKFRVVRDQAHNGFSLDEIGLRITAKEYDLVILGEVDVPYLLIRLLLSSGYTTGFTSDYDNLYGKPDPTPSHAIPAVARLSFRREF